MASAVIAVGVSVLHSMQPEAEHLHMSSGGERRAVSSFLQCLVQYSRVGLGGSCWQARVSERQDRMEL